MSVISMASRFDSTCKVCSAQIRAGDAIYKVNDHWCKDQSCGKSDNQVHMEKRRIDLENKTPPGDLDSETCSVIDANAVLLYKINQRVLHALKRYDEAPNPAMVGQFTKIIYDKLGPSSSSSSSSSSF